jgi:hypothetical protein
VHRDPSTHLDPDRRELVPSYPDSRVLLVSLAHDPVLSERNDDRFLEVSKITMNIEIIVLKVEDWVRYELTGTVVRDVTPTVDVKYFHSLLLQFVSRREEMSVGSRFANCVNMLVLCQYEHVRNLGLGPKLEQQSLQLPRLSIARQTEVTDKKIFETLRVFHQM